MHVTALLTVKDEAELINLSIDHLLEIQVDTIIVVDVASSDGTREAVEQRLSERINLLDIEEAISTPFEVQIKDFLDIVYRKQQTDWFINLDADEFWLPKTGSIKDVPQLWSKENEALSVNRFNICLEGEIEGTQIDFGPLNYKNILLFVDVPAEFRRRLGAGTAAWSEGVPLPKIATRPHRLKNIAVTGFHSVQGAEGDNVQTATSEKDLIIAHLPFTTFARFERKIENVRRFIERRAGSSPDPAWEAPNVGWHWRRWLAIEDEGLLGVEFQRQMLSSEEIRERRLKGAIKSAAELLGYSEARS